MRLLAFLLMASSASADVTELAKVQRQRENSFIAGAAIDQGYFKGEIRKLTEEPEKERERSKGLVGRIAIMEANAAKLGFDPEEMHKPIQRPIRTVSRAGTGTVPATTRSNASSKSVISTATVTKKCGVVVKL